MGALGIGDLGSVWDSCCKAGLRWIVSWGRVGLCLSLLEAHLFLIDLVPLVKLLPVLEGDLGPTGTFVRLVTWDMCT